MHKLFNSIILILCLGSILAAGQTPESRINTPQELTAKKDRMDKTGRHPEIVFPGKEWRLTPPAKFNFSQAKLDSIETYFEDIGGDALMVLYSGYCIAAFGDTEEKIQCRSIRKDFLSACYGLYRDTFDLDRTLADMGLDDKEKLTAAEKQASLKNLLTTSSGIFHPAAYEPYGAADRKPPRGVYKPGEKFFYNNWDYNILGAIFNTATGKDLFEVFATEIAKPAGMQDFVLEDTEYYYDEQSLYPAYLFSTSARDDARFALLYLADGKWRDSQILPPAWIAESTALHFDFKNTNGYGYMWWVTTDDYEGSQWAFFARGNSGQFIYINPYRSLVIVFRADPGTIIKKWLGMRVKWEESAQSIPMIIRLVAE